MFGNLRAMSLSLAATVMLCWAAPLQACSVCNGDPESNIAKGAVAGVILLGSVIGSVLLGIAGFICFWTVRARRLTRPEECGGEFSGAGANPEPTDLPNPE